MRTIGIIFLVIFFSVVVKGQIKIVDCNFLQNNITLQNSTVSYYLDSDIDCSTVNPFIPLGYSIGNPKAFQATLDGRGFKIKKVNISSFSYAYLGIFSSVDGGIIKNLTLQDITITGNTGKYMGAMAAYSYNMTLEDVHMVTSELSQNIIKTESTMTYVAGLVGLMENGVINRISVTNTTVFAPNSSSVGGVLNLGNYLIYASDVKANYVFNYGFPANPTQTIVTGQYSVGGVGGSINGVSFNNSGVVRGRINALGISGGFCGRSMMGSIDSIFVRPDVFVNCTTDYCGGVFGYVVDSPSALFMTFSISNIYSRANNIAGVNKLGGLSGMVEQTLSLNRTLTFSNAYAATSLSGTSELGALFGNVTWNLFTLSQVYFDNSIASDSRGIGLNCSNLFINVTNNFPFSKWGNDRLKIEPDYVTGVCNCTSSCPPPTVPPTTIMPTVIPTVAPTSTFLTVNFSGSYLVEGSCQNSLNCCCPIGKVSVLVTQTNFTAVYISIPEVTGNCTITQSQTVAFILNAPTSGSFPFNNLLYTMNYSDQKIKVVSSTNNCSATFTCESGKCRSLTSNAPSHKFSRYMLLITFLITFFLF